MTGVTARAIAPLVVPLVEFDEDGVVVGAAELATWVVMPEGWALEAPLDAAGALVGPPMGAVTVPEIWARTVALNVPVMPCILETRATINSRSNITREFAYENLAENASRGKVGFLGSLAVSD